MYPDNDAELDGERAKMWPCIEHMWVELVDRTGCACLICGEHRMYVFRRSQAVLLALLGLVFVGCLVLGMNLP